MSDSKHTTESADYRKAVVEMLVSGLTRCSVRETIYTECVRETDGTVGLALMYHACDSVVDGLFALVDDYDRFVLESRSGPKPSVKQILMEVADRLPCEPESEDDQ